MQIVADTREKNSLVISELIGYGINVEIKQLNVADYIISKDIAIERKTVSDFVSSMINKRLAKQLIDLKQNYSKPVLIIEGIGEENLYVNKKYPNIHENAVRGMVLSVLTEFNVPIVFTQDYGDTAKYLLLLIKRQNKQPGEISLNAKRKAFSVSEQQQIILESLPGIGPTIAKELLKKFKTIKNIANAGKEELGKINSLNKKKAEIIYNLLRHEYKF